MKELRIQQFSKLTTLYNNFIQLESIPSGIVIHSDQILNHETKHKFSLSFFKCFSNENLPKGKTSILIFGSQYKPGGGVVNGAKAQEEDIALVSSWYYQCKGLDEYYKQNVDARNTDLLIYADHGYLFFDNFYQELPEYIPVSFIGCAAPNLTGLSQQGIDIDVYPLLSERIKNILLFAEQQKIEHLILGAWGCGVFKLDPQKVADCFNTEIKKGYYSGHIQFNLPDPTIFDIFLKTIL